MDGVTSALELEIGTADVDGWYQERKGKALVNFGVSVGHIPARRTVIEEGPGLLPKADSPAAQRAASDAEIAEMRSLVAKGLDRGALGVGFGVQYTPGASRWEILEMFRVAGRYGAPCHIHIRTMGEKKGAEAVIGLEEAISAATISGAPLQVSWRVQRGDETH